MEMRLLPAIMSDVRPSHDRHGLVLSPHGRRRACGAELVGRRGELLERLSGTAARSLAWLARAGGHGKTTLMAQLRKQVVARGGGLRRLAVRVVDSRP